MSKVHQLLFTAIVLILCFVKPAFASSAPLVSQPLSTKNDLFAFVFQNVAKPENAPTILWRRQINYAEAFYQQDLRELEATYQAAQSHAQKMSQIPSAIPWAERPVVYWSDTGLAIEGYVGQLRCPSLNVNLAIYWSFEQSTVDDPNTASIWGYSGLPGEPEYATSVYEHNYQFGKILARCTPEDLIYFDTIYGNYIYQYCGSEVYGIIDDLVNHSINPAIVRRASPNTTDYRIGREGYSSSFPGGRIAQACSEDADTNNGQLQIITCYPLNTYETDQRLLLRFNCLSGPLLIS